MTDVAAPPEAKEIAAVGRGFGTGMLRKEDDRLLRGSGRFADDIDPAHPVEMAVGRCPYPHARIGAIEVEEALKLDGVLEIFTGKDAAERSEMIGILRPVPGAPAIPHFALALGTATYEGQPVVSVAATSRAIAEDAIELIEVEYEPLPHVSNVHSAMAR